MFGQDLGFRITTDEVRAETWVEQNSSPGSAIVNGVAGPVFLTRRYPVIGYEDRLLSHREFSGRVLGAADVPPVEHFASGVRPGSDLFLLLSRRQDDYAQLNGISPAGSIPSLALALEQGSAAFRLVYRRPTAWVFEYIGRAAGPAVPTSASSRQAPKRTGAKTPSRPRRSRPARRPVRSPRPAPAARQPPAPVVSSPSPVPSAPRSLVPSLPAPRPRPAPAPAPSVFDDSG